MKRRIYLIAASVLTAALTLSCADDLEVSNGNESPRDISFEVSAEQDWMQTTVTRAAASRMQPTTVEMTENGVATGLTLRATTVNGINSTAFEETATTRGERKTALWDNFSVMAYEYAFNETWGTQAVAYTDLVTKDGNSWKMTGAHYWPSAGNVVRFVAVAPQNVSDLTMTPAVGITGLPTVTLTVTKDVEQQKDVMAAISTETAQSTHSGKVKLPFKHLLTCVRFAVGNNLNILNCRIKAIRVMNAAQKGTAIIDDVSAWSADATTRTNFEMDDIMFPITQYSSQGTVIAPEETDGINKTTMLMIPQSFTETNQTIEIDYLDASNVLHTISAPLKDQEWLPGTTVTYELSTGASVGTNVLTVTPIVVGHEGGPATFQVTSYSSSGNTITRLPWRIVGYSLDEGHTFYAEKPAACNWVGIATTSGEGGSQAQTCRMIIDATSKDSTKTLVMESGMANNALSVQSKMLYDNGFRGGVTGYYDLSTHDFYGNETLRNTANCYVIDRAGYYMLPLVYGNAIKNGKDNTIAYSGTKKSYDNSKDISDPWISATATPTSAKLLWQDAEGLVSENASDVFIQQEPDGYWYLKFLIPRSDSSLKPGNAVLAVFNGSTIMWSWHIWVTPVDVYNTIEVRNKYNNPYYFMPSPLGYVTLRGGLDYYPTRSMIIKIQQSTGLTATFRLTQAGGKTFSSSVATQGYCTHYSWGRKDPFSGGDGVKMATGTTEPAVYGRLRDNYPTNSDYKCTTGTNITSVPASIQYPYIRHIASSQWTTTTNLWNINDFTGADENGQVIKTIYDPCPVGFNVPPTGAFSSFTTTGALSQTSSQFRTYGTFDYGWFLKTTPSDTDFDLMHWPAVGFLHNGQNNIWRTGMQGHTWTAMLYYTCNIWNIDANTKGMGIYKEGYVNYGMALRPVRSTE
jgi:hypothetical protein